MRAAVRRLKAAYTPRASPSPVTSGTGLPGLPRRERKRSREQRELMVTIAASRSCRRFRLRDSVLSDARHGGRDRMDEIALLSRMRCCSDVNAPTDGGSVGMALPLTSSHVIELGTATAAKGMSTSGGERKARDSICSFEDQKKDLGYRREDFGEWRRRRTGR